MANILVTGATRSGKTTAEIKRIVEAVEQGGRQMAAVIIDPHTDSLAWGVLLQLVARGLAPRILFERLSNLDRVLGWQFLARSTAATPLLRLAEDDESIHTFADLLVRRRGLHGLQRFPLMEEWLQAALKFFLYQPEPLSLALLPLVFLPDHPFFRRMLSRCQDPLVAQKFWQLSDGKIPRSQYAPTDRLVCSLCNSPAFQIRCGSSFQLPAFLDRGGILIVEGGSGGTVSEDALRTMMGAVILQTIQYVRRRPRPVPRVLLSLDEATNADLIGASGYEVKALAELQKRGLDMDILVQSPNFPGQDILDGVLTNCRRHEWFACGNSAVARMGAQDLGDPDYQAQLLTLEVGERIVKDHGQVFREYVQPLEDPWAFPGLAARKAQKALEIIYRRPEYRDGETPAMLTSQSRSSQPANPPAEPHNPNLGI